MNAALKILPLAIFLGACSFVPNYKEPALPQAEKWMAASLEAHPGGRKATELGFREYFLDPQLQELIRIALAHNHDLRRAALNTRKTAEIYHVRQSARAPSVVGTGGATRARTSGAINGSGEGRYSNNYTVAVGVSSFELDFFGRVRALSQAALDTYLQTREAQDAAQLAVIRSVSEGYYRARIAKALLQLAQQTLDSRRRTVELAQSQFDAGVIDTVTLKGYENAIETARAAYYRHQRSYEQAQNSLSVVLGVPYSQLSLPKLRALDEQFAELRVPAGIPSYILERRPDIRAAEYALRAADANIGAAKAALFPKISLTGQFGYASTELDELIKSPNALWSIGPSLSVPIFNRGRLRANVAISELNRTILVEDYQSAVASAFQEVGNALIARQTYQKQYQAERRAAQAQHEMLELERERFKAGVTDGLSLLDAERHDLLARENQLTTQLQLLHSLVTLYTAMGGGLAEYAETTPSRTDQARLVTRTGEKTTDKDVSATSQQAAP